MKIERDKKKSLPARAIALILAMALSLTACGSSGKQEGDGGKDSNPSVEEKGSSMKENNPSAGADPSDQGKEPSESGLNSSGLNIKEVMQQGVTEAGQAVKGKDGKTYLKTRGTFFDAFDTVITLTAYTENQKDFDTYFQMTKEEFVRLHQLYDNYHEYPGVKNVMTINKAAGKEAVSVDPDLYRLIQFGLDSYESGLGKVNIAMGSVLDLWHEQREAADIFSGGKIKEEAGKSSQDKEDKAQPGEETGKEPANQNSGSNKENGAQPEKQTGGKTPTGQNIVQGQLPDADALKKAGQHMDIHKVKLNEKDQSVYLEDPDMSLDLGAVAKGYATELVARKLEKAGLKSGIISAGGNVRLIGAPIDDRENWLVGIVDPRHEKESGLCAVQTPPGYSVVTSGDYERYYYVDGKKYHHIIDPFKLYPVTYYPSVTIITKDSALADFLSTAFFLSDQSDAKKLMENFSDQDIQVLWINQENQLTYSPGLEGRILQ